MATRTVRFFSQPEEFLTILQRVVEVLGLIVIVFRKESEPVALQADKLFTVDEIEGLGIWRLYLAQSDFDIASIGTTDFQPGRLSLLQIDLPRQCGNVLLIGQLAVKTDWFDERTGGLSDNPRVMPFFKSVASRLRKHLMSPVLAENIMTGGKAVYRNIGYTLSAKAFAEEGGEWMQEGVNNIRYRIPPA